MDMYAGISWLVSKASCECSLMGGLGEVFGAIFSVEKLVCVYFAEQFFVAAETGKAMYGYTNYIITINTFCGVPIIKISRSQLVLM